MTGLQPCSRAGRGSESGARPGRYLFHAVVRGSSVDGETARRVAFALLAVAALAAAAATIDTTVTGGVGGGIGGASGGPDADPSDPVFGPPPEAGAAAVGSICVPVLARPPVVAALVAALIAGHYAVYRRTGTRESVIATAVGVGLPLTALWGILTACRLGPAFEVPALGGFGGFPIPVGSGGLGSGATGDGSVATPTVLFGLLLLVALVGALVLLFAATTDDSDPDADVTGDRPEDEPDADVRGVGAAAGDAADRIESDADVGNQVYRAWVEMTAYLDVDRPDSSTPGEFAAAAVDAGMDPDDVDELTRLFERVRYGDERATDARAERAVAALRRIESAYSGGES